MKVKLIALTKIVDADILADLKSDTPESLIMYAARVSNPENQTSGKPGLLGYCIKHQHWSVFETANMTVEITTTRGIAPQILRHRSFCFQEFSQRYAPAMTREVLETRLQDPKNRQNSTVDENGQHDFWFKGAQDAVWEQSSRLYNEALKRGVAKEQARFLLPLATETKLYMTGNLRNFIHYCSVRCGKDAQKEHRDIAQEIWKIIRISFPIVAEAVEKDDKMEHLKSIK
jgi:thymidylate synthase (FAD)